MSKAKTSLENYTRALKSLEEAINTPLNEIVRDATIQRFEFCVELSWKTSKKIMGTSTTSPKQVVREMAQNNLIENVESWLLAIDKRNESSHTYNEDLAIETYNFIKSFYLEFEKLKTKLEENL